MTVDTCRERVADLASKEAAYFDYWDPLPGGLVAVARRIMAAKSGSEKAKAKVALRPRFLDAA